MNGHRTKEGQTTKRTASYNNMTSEKKLWIRAYNTQPVTINPFNPLVPGVSYMLHSSFLCLDQDIALKVKLERQLRSYATRINHSS